MTALHIALEVDGDGAHPAAWRHSGRPPGEAITARAVVQIVTTAEAAGITLVTFDDSPVPPSDGLDAAGRIEAGTRASYVSTRTARVGLAPTLHVTTTEPFHLATQLASLDWASHGRGAWVVGAANDAPSRATIGAQPLSEHQLHQEIVDVVEIARSLWDSWEDDAVIKDESTGRYLDPQKVHPIAFTRGELSILGPLITPRPPQGQVIVIAPDHLGIDAQADIVLVNALDIESITARAAQAKAAGAPLAFAEIQVVLDAAEPAGRRLQELDAATPWPDDGRLRHVGSAAALVELLSELARHVDGVRLHLAVHAIDLPILIEQVLPALASRGWHEPSRDEGTLRFTLGLPRLPSRFAAAANANA
jgi:alkanesulfonate monooxygenase SsuD/methylene tetrahydromethanopterin reductase-like flavin-dependent oxidoreductase (luciferase family)